MCASPSLVVLAAGLGSRYGGIKQMDPVGPAGEFVLDYSVYDALQAGFDRVVFVIRKELEEPLRAHFGARLPDLADVHYVYQELADLPPGHALPPDRVKPWGTGHAIWSARSVVDGPFGVINADDFYGAGAYRELGAFLRSDRLTPAVSCLVAYRLDRTLSAFGSVSRGICQADADGFLTEVVERTRIEMAGDSVRYKDGAGNWCTLNGDELASLNLWGFGPDLFGSLESLFSHFLAEAGDDPKREFYIPTVVDTLVKQGAMKSVVLTTDEHWFGMTYRDDRDRVKTTIAELTAAGRYPTPLWG